MINTQGYKIEIVGGGSELKTSARDFGEVKKLLRNSRINGQDRIAVVRSRDDFEIFIGDVQRARVQFGL